MTTLYKDLFCCFALENGLINIFLKKSNNKPIIDEQEILSKRLICLVAKDYVLHSQRKINQNKMIQEFPEWRQCLLYIKLYSWFKKTQQFLLSIFFIVLYSKYNNVLSGSGKTELLEV